MDLSSTDFLRLVNLTQTMSGYLMSSQIQVLKAKNHNDHSDVDSVPVYIKFKNVGLCLVYTRVKKLDKHDFSTLGYEQTEIDIYVDNYE